MIYKELERIVIENKRNDRSTLYIRNLLKEYLQIYVLNYIYTNPKYNKELIFTGGTCLRLMYGLSRLSEDLDFDYDENIDTQILADRLLNYFQTKYKFDDITISLKQKGQQVLLKFPVLKNLNLAKGNESNMLYLKMDLRMNLSSIYDVQITSKSTMNFNFVALHYKLSSLMAGKIAAILTRKRFVGKENKEIIKGRDYYDLLWFLKKGVKPNLDRISELLGEKVTGDILKEKLDQKIEILAKKYKNDFESDLIPLIENIDFVPIYIENYVEEYERSVKYLSLMK
jgi:predicted nucleotidyltransferase component of viral defense system